MCLATLLEITGMLCTKSKTKMKTKRGKEEERGKERKRKKRERERRGKDIGTGLKMGGISTKEESAITRFV